MANHRTGTRKEWLEARLQLLDAEKEVTPQSDDLARRRRELPWVRVDKAYLFDTEDGEKPRLRTCSMAVRSCSCTTSCSAPTGTKAARAVRGSPTASMRRTSISRTTMSRSLPSLARRSRSCSRTGTGWAGASRGRRRLEVTSTMTSTSRSTPTSRPSNTTTGALTSSNAEMSRGGTGLASSQG
jgi:hypothetical protein